MSDRTAVAYAPGLEGVVAIRTRLSSVDGAAGRLTIAGFFVEELAGRATFEETLYLLWNGALPDGEQLSDLRRDLAVRRALPKVATDVIAAAAAEQVTPMDALRMASGTLGSRDGDDRALSGSSPLSRPSSPPTGVSREDRNRSSPTPGSRTRPTTST